LHKTKEMDKRLVKIGYVQSECVSDKKSNIYNTIEKIKQAAQQGAQIICSQELFSTIYFCDKENYKNFALAESIPGPTTELLSALCKELNIVLIASLFERRTEGIYHNTAAVIDADGKILGIYRKQHIPDDPGYCEKFYFTPGDEGFKSFQTKYANIGVLICWDQWYPEAARLTAMKGAEILFYPTAIGWPDGQDIKLSKKEFEAWQTIQRSHAIANGIHVVAVNRTGIEADNVFWGGSFISDPFGEILHQSPHDKEDIHIHDVDLNLTEYYRSHWPFFRDRRIDSYSSITKRFDN
jgi:N-carbamoylputrescine amidase